MTLNTFALASPVGFWTVTTNDTQIVAVDYQGEICPTDRKPETALELQVDNLLHRYFEGEAVDFSDLPIQLPKPDEHLISRVMNRLREIPLGEVYSYQWLAEQLDMPQAPRAVGSALGRNPIPIIVPCHRIVAKHGKLGGFMRGCEVGPRIKTFLLNLEGHRFENERFVHAPEERMPALV